MTEKVQIKQATLYLGDCRDLPPEVLTADTLLSDPVWPNCPAGLLQCSNDPMGLLAGCLERVTESSLKSATYRMVAA